MLAEDEIAFFGVFDVPVVVRVAVAGIGDLERRNGDRLEAFAEASIAVGGEHVENICVSVRIWDIGSCAKYLHLGWPSVAGLFFLRRAPRGWVLIRRGCG